MTEERLSASSTVPPHEINIKYVTIVTLHELKLKYNLLPISRNIFSKCCEQLAFCIFTKKGAEKNNSA